MKNKSLRNTIIYVSLIVGLLLLYVLDVESMLYPNQQRKVVSKVNFVYQQF